MTTCVAARLTPVCWRPGGSSPRPMPTRYLAGSNRGAMVAGLDRVQDEFVTPAREMAPALEDVHMNVETRLIELIGEPGRRLHTARSRNDQVATDLRLYARQAAVELIGLIDRSRLEL